MEGLTPVQCLQIGNQLLDAENFVEAMRFFAQCRILYRDDEGLLSGFLAAASSYCEQLMSSPVYNGIEKDLDENARVFYNEGIRAFLSKDFGVARLYFAEALTWDSVNGHLYDCFRTSVESEFNSANPVYIGVEKDLNENARGFYKAGMSAFFNKEYGVAQLYFAEALKWDSVNGRLYDCFRTSVELEFRTQRRQ